MDTKASRGTERKMTHGRAATRIPAFSLGECSLISQLEQSTLRRLCESGELPASKIGKTWLVHEKDWQRFWAERMELGRA